MSTVLPNGTVLPHGLLNVQNRAAYVAAIKAGFVVASYAPDDDGNKSKLCTEYDVETIEQFENKGTTTLLYRNCLSTQSFGGIADYVEYTVRPQTYQGDNPPSFSDQDGSIVLIQCLDNIGSKALVTGCLMHPDRDTNITTTDPQLYGEYNGVAVQVNTDGSTSLIFNGATDSKGDVIDDSQNSTTVQISKTGTVNLLDANGTMISTDENGSVQILTSNGNLVFLNNDDNEISINQKDGNVIGMNSTGVTISDATGKQIIAIDDSTVQLTSGGTMVEQSTGHTINSGSVNISGLGGIKIKDHIGGEVNIKNGMVAIGNSTAELLDLFNQTLTALQSLSVATALGPSGPPINVAQFIQIQTMLTLIKGSL